MRRGEESHRALEDIEEIGGDGGDGGDHSTLDDIEVVVGQRYEQSYRGDHSTLDEIMKLL